MNDRRMKAHVRRRVNSRSDVGSLTALEQCQLVEAGRVLVGAADLDRLLTWCDLEKLGWLQVSIEVDGEVAYDFWQLASGDEGLIFAHSAEHHCGIALSQTYLVDAEGARDRLVARLQNAIDSMVRPRFIGWREGAVEVTTDEPVEADEVQGVFAPVWRKA